MPGTLGVGEILSLGATVTKYDPAPKMSGGYLKTVTNFVCPMGKNCLLSSCCPTNLMGRDLMCRFGIILVSQWVIVTPFCEWCSHKKMHSSRVQTYASQHYRLYTAQHVSLGQDIEFEERWHRGNDKDWLELDWLCWNSDHRAASVILPVQAPTRMFHLSGERESTE